MATAISLWFDRQLEGRIRMIWSELVQRRISAVMHAGPYRPHITLGAWEAALTPDSEAQLRKALHVLRSLPISFNAVGIFPGGEGVAFLAPVVTTALLELHCAVHHCMERFETQALPYYRPGSWTPHCTLTWGGARQQALKTAEFVLSDFDHLAGEGVAIGLIAIPAEIELSSIDLMR